MSDSNVNFDHFVYKMRHGNAPPKVDDLEEFEPCIYKTAEGSYCFGIKVASDVQDGQFELQSTVLDKKPYDANDGF